MSPAQRLRVCFPFVGDTVGGSHLATLLLAEELRELGVDPLIVVHQSGLLIEELNRRGIEWIEAPNVNVVGNCSIALQPVRMLNCVAPLAAFLRKYKVDIVHANDLRMNLTWLVATRITGAKFIWHQHSATSSPRLFIYTFFASAVLTISEFCRKRLRVGRAPCVEVIDNPFDVSSVAPDRQAAKAELCQALGVSSQASIVAFVGNFLERKRPEFFLECAARVQRDCGDHVLFVMFGNPRQPLRDRVETKMASLGLSEACFLMGARFPIEPWLAGCDVLIAPARHEPFGRTLVEAMLVGTPVVASDEGGHPEIIENKRTGILVPPEDSAAFASAVCDVLCGPHCARQIASDASNEARRRFSSERHAKRVLQIYRNVTQHVVADDFR